MSIGDKNILIINKPIGITSHDVVDIIRKKTGVRRVGHAGTLDPLASGVLIILMGREMTKRQKEFMNLEKEYEAELTFGFTSATDDAEGPLKPRANQNQLSKLTSAQIKKILPLFIGTIKQKPPDFSAIKIHGQPMYKQARRGKISTTKLLPRLVQINTLKLIKFTPTNHRTPPKAKIRVKCQKGVYIRSLARDIGEKLSVGAYVSELIRTRIGQYTINKSKIQKYFDF